MVNQTLRHDGTNWVASNNLVNTGTNVGIGTSTINPSAVLQINGNGSQGVLFPPMTTAQRDAIATPAVGLLIYNTDCNKFNFFNGVVWNEMAAVAPPAQPGAITSPTTMCPGQTQAFLIDPVAGATSYVWTVPAGWSYTVITSNIINVTAGATPGDVCVTAINGCLTSLVRCKSITINCP
jgi:hypothetical protein